MNEKEKLISELEKTVTRDVNYERGRSEGYLEALEKAGVLVDHLVTIVQEYEDPLNKNTFLSREDMVRLADKALSEWEKLR